MPSRIEQGLPREAGAIYRPVDLLSQQSALKPVANLVARCSRATKTLPEISPGRPLVGFLTRDRSALANGHLVYVKLSVNRRA